jgi:hypothetical protein
VIVDFTKHVKCGVWPRETHLDVRAHADGSRVVERILDEGDQVL